VYGVTKIIRPLFLLPPFSVFFNLFRKLVYYAIGEMDYYKSGSLAQTFKNVYKVDISKDLEKISVPTLIVWGEEDAITPLADGKFMYSRIPNAQLNIVKNEGHKLPYSSPQKLADAVEKFLS
jgi:pimeloyl-ACP methyl ester carboxylesterase